MACKPPNVFEPWLDDLYKELDKKIGSMISNGADQLGLRGQNKWRYIENPIYNGIFKGIYVDKINKLKLI